VRKYLCQKKPFFFDFSNIELPNVDMWGIVTLPIRLLGRVAIDSNLGAQTYDHATRPIDDVRGPRVGGNDRFT
jgi:hypothetical protein